MAGKRSALIVATGEYKDSRLPDLTAPAEDASALRAVLANPDIGAFDVKVALNSRVETLRRTLEAFFANRSRDDLLLVHFSGHGLKDDEGQLHLAAADTQLDRLLSTAVDADWVNRLMARSRSETIALFLDCCFAGAFTSSLTRRAAGDTAGVKDAFQGRGLFVIAASDAMQYSFEGGRQIGEPPAPSAFTKALVDGLATGEADRNEDGQVSINELFDFLEDRIHETSPSQTPTKSALNQVGDWMIARSTRQSGIRLLPETVRAHMTSDITHERVSVLFDLGKLLDDSDPRVAEAATEALRTLVNDDSLTVSTRAQSLLDDGAARPRPAPGTSDERSRRGNRNASPTSPDATVLAIPDIGPIDREMPAMEPASRRSRPRIWRVRSAISSFRPTAWLGQSILAIATGLTAVALAIVVVPYLTSMGQAQPTPTPSSSSGATTPAITGAPSTSSVPTDRLTSNQELNVDGTGVGAGGNRLVDSTDQYALLFLSDGDVAVQHLETRVVQWRPEFTPDGDAVKILMQGDGNLVIRNGANGRLWDIAHQTVEGPYELTLQTSGNLVIRRSGSQTPIWQSQTDAGCIVGCR